MALTTTLPWPVTVTSAVNAMAHTVEALYAADRTAETDAMAVEGLGALARGLRSLAPRPRRPRRARRPALRGVAGGPVPRAPSAWGCTTSSATPSAAASASRTPPPTPWCCPHAMAYNAPAAPEAMSAAAAALGVDDAPSGLQALVARLGGPTDLRRPRVRPSPTCRGPPTWPPRGPTPTRDRSTATASSSCSPTRPRAPRSARHRHRRPPPRSHPPVEENR